MKTANGPPTGTTGAAFGGRGGAGAASIAGSGGARGAGAGAGAGATVFCKNKLFIYLLFFLNKVLGYSPMD